MRPTITQQLAAVPAAIRARMLAADRLEPGAAAVVGRFFAAVAQRDEPLAASGRMRLAGCAHATTFDPAWMRGTGAAPGEDSEDTELLQRHGDAHGSATPGAARGRGRGVVEIVRESLSPSQVETRAFYALDVA